MSKILMALAAFVALMPRQTGSPAADRGTALEATIRFTIAKTEAPSDGRPTPYDNFGPLIAQLVTPNGAVDIHYLVARDQARAELNGRLGTLDAGTVVLEHAGDAMLRVLNPENKTWYEIPAEANPAATLGAPRLDIEPTTDLATIAGEPAQRFTFTETMHVPRAAGDAPPDFPSELRLTGDVWTTDAFTGAGYTGVMNTLQAFAAIPGIAALTAGGRFPLRLVLHSNVLPGYEIRSDVTAVREVRLDPEAFTVPQGYLHVLAPGR